MSAYGKEWQRIVDAMKENKRTAGSRLVDTPANVAELRRQITALIECADRWEALEKELYSLPEDMG